MLVKHSCVKEFRDRRGCIPTSGCRKCIFSIQKNGFPGNIVMTIDQVVYKHYGHGSISIGETICRILKLACTVTLRYYRKTRFLLNTHFRPPEVGIHPPLSQNSLTHEGLLAFPMKHTYICAVEPHFSTIKTLKYGMQYALV